jgi:hypothetical protein
MLSNALIIFASSALVAAHGGVIGYTINGQWQKG